MLGGDRLRLPWGDIGCKKDCVCSAGDPLGHFFWVIPYPVLKVNENLQQLNPGKMTNQDPSRMKVWVTL